jgi:hypothetical protein
MDVCVSVFCVYVVLCVGSGLATGWSPFEGVLLTAYRIKKLKKRPRSKGLKSHKGINGNRVNVSWKSLVSIATRIPGSGIIIQLYKAECLRFCCAENIVGQWENLTGFLFADTDKHKTMQDLRFPQWLLRSAPFCWKWRRTVRYIP